MAEWVVRQTAEQEVGSSNPGIPPPLKHTCGEGDWMLCWLYTLAEVSHQRWISGNVYHVRLRKVWIRQNPLWLWNPEETSPEVWNRGISGPTNGHVSNKNLKKKKKKEVLTDRQKEVKRNKIREMKATRKDLTKQVEGWRVRRVSSQKQ